MNSSHNAEDCNKTGNKVTYTKSTTTNTGYRYTTADFNSGSVYHGMMKDFRLVSDIVTLPLYTPFMAPA